MSIIIDMNKDYSRAIPDTWQDIAQVFAALGDEHRQRILLTFEPGERLNVGQIAEVSTLARSTVSHHLKVLREAGVLNAERVGKEIYFSVNKSFLQEAFGRVSTYLDLYL
ncbi:ArsR/SmtB family transcription factor [Zoogloea sp.]|uniref:ArsR/SmtB family transcription factor n=1 Tax=Zoogloea sp. TaxID=49181 RepID=UPI0035AF2CCA|nr:metalloregulator ArsR/SmtB family transcription factor [Rhodocyclales bacterium]